MEPNKLENQIREKINAREIKPSAPSWDRLDVMLSVAENKKPKRKLNWIYIAAGIVGFVFVGLFFFNQNNEIPVIQSNQTVVESNSNNVNPEKEKSSQEVILQTNPSVKKRTEVKNTVIASLSESKQEAVKAKGADAKQQQSVKNEIIIQENIAQVAPQKLEEKPKETVSQSTLLASNEPNKQEKVIQNKPKVKIDPNALLSQVDGEIEYTFRQKVIKTISKKFESTREAVVSRNQE